MLRGGIGLGVALWVMALLGPMPASDLYTTRVITSGTAPERRDIGFAQCLRDVVVKVTGDSRLLNEQALAQQAKHAGELVASHTFRDRMGGIPLHDEQGSYDRPHDLTCVFDPPKLDAFLHTLGREPWLTRPRLVAVVAIRDTKSVESMLASDSNGQRDQDMRTALLSAADRLALPLVVPSQRQLSQAGLVAKTLGSADPARLDTLARIAGGDVALVGTLMWSEEDLGWVANWRTEADGENHNWGISGVGFDDAFRNAVAGAAQVLSGHGDP
ncbi:DUF2066 domain-containing protein [Aminobacter sp. AP02]|uniref:DUF2066 domain-containing protein n=1 Tax=Aminobacter sp. AP02 TaxID=2135737 RepID=UPI000D6DAD9F|nr:DUF2066 domain-containing protein [Aminobacter sp. AP02]PWK70780.1 hypothetical protein C8K44_107260 [Aminobacter sp. AP02]